MSYCFTFQLSHCPLLILNGGISSHGMKDIRESYHIMKNKSSAVKSYLLGFLVPCEKKQGTVGGGHDSLFSQIFKISNIWNLLSVLIRPKGLNLLIFV